MREAIGEAVFDGLTQNLEELSFAAPLFGRYIPSHIDSDFQIRMANDSDRRIPQVSSNDVLAAAYVLSLLYVDALLGNKSVLRIVEEQMSAAARRVAGGATAKDHGAARKGLPKDFLMTFLVNATVVCARRISSPSPSRPQSPRDEHARAILCCGALSGMGLVLGLTADRGHTSPYLSEQQTALLEKELLQMPLLARPQGALDALANQLDQLTTQLYDAPASSRMSESAALVFWLLQIFNLYSDVANLLKTLQATDHPLKDLQLIGLHDTCLRAKSGATAVAEAKVSSWIVGVHAGLVQNLSPDTMCWLAIYLMNSNKSEATRIVNHMLTAVFKDYSAGGRLSVSGPLAFGSDPGSSTETLAILLYCDLFRRVSDYRKVTGTIAVALGNLRPSVFLNHFESIIAHLRWLMGKEEQGLHSEDEQTAEAAFARIIFVTCSTLLCEELLNRHARSALEVQLRLSNPKGEYPPELEFVVDAVIRPIKEGGEARNNASYSMVLYGPPGTAKTTLAKKIAYDLGWPFLEIAQRDFLREGSDRIDAQADKIFRYCGYLRDVVILFDELEELILDRETLQSDKESRLLTTSMLPRIQQLRDRRAVVFIFATNRVKTLDLAATRLGRFDIIKYVRLPALERRVAMLMAAAEAAGSRYPVLAGALKTFAQRPDIDQLTAKMAYSDINYMLGQVRRLELAQKKPDGKSSKVETQMAATLGKEIEMIFSRHVTSDKLSKSLDECQELCKLDRPPS